MAKFSRWMAPFALLLLLDARCLSDATGLARFDAVAYGAGVALSLLSCVWIAVLILTLPRLAALPVAAALAVAFSLVLASNAVLFHHFRQFTTPYMLRFIVDDPRYLGDYAATFGRGPWGALVVALSVGLCALWLKGPRMPRATSRRVVFLLFAPLVVGFGHYGNLVRANGRHLDALSSTITATIKFRRQDWSSRRLHGFPRTQLAARSRDVPDVLLVVNESWDRRTVAALGGKPGASPLLAARLQRPGSFLFRYGLANSTATDVSVPSILSGVGPEEDARQLEEMPLAWDWAKAAGMATLFVSSQRLTWNRLDEFLRTPGLDRFVTGPEIGGPVVNDLGIDDLEAAEAYCRAAREAPDGAPLFSVFNSNALHQPFQRSSAKLRGAGEVAGPFDTAVRILDQALDTVVGCAESRRRPVVVVMTGDHGLSLERGVPRLYSFFPDAVGVPFLVSLPPELGAAQPAWAEALGRNRERNVSNLDVVPTIVEVLGGPGPGNEATFARLQGRSLLQDVAADRPIVALNTNDFKKIDYEGFGVYIDSRFLVVSAATPTTLEDRAGGPNLWPAATEADKAPFLAVIRARFHLNRIYQHETH